MKALLIDSSLCIACKACQVACKSWNRLPVEPGTETGSLEFPEEVSGTRYTIVKPSEYGEDRDVRLLFFKQQCRHCQVPICGAMCPRGAIVKKATGAVVIIKKKCKPHRCVDRPCEKYCPYGIPRFNESLGRYGKERKCTLCHGKRIKNDGAGRDTACADACPTGSISFGGYGVMRQQAKDRVAELLPQYPNANIYPRKRMAGKTSVMWILLHRSREYDVGVGQIIP